MNPIRENKLSERIQSVFVLFIMVSSLVTGLGVSLVANAPTAVAATTGSIVCSCDGNSGNFWGNQTISIQIVDPDIITSTSPTPLVRIRNATGTNLGLNITQATDGSWYAFIGNGSIFRTAHNTYVTAKHIGGMTYDMRGTPSSYSTTALPLPGQPWSRVFGTGSPKVVNATTYIANEPIPMGGRYNITGSSVGSDPTQERTSVYNTNKWPFVQLFNLTGGTQVGRTTPKSSDTIIIEYVDTTGAAGVVSVTKTINYQATKATVSNDRTSIPPGARLRLTVTAPTWNRDPTAADTFGKFEPTPTGAVVSADGRGLIAGHFFRPTFTFTGTDTTASGTSKSFHRNIPNDNTPNDGRIKLNFTETGANTGIFEAFVDTARLQLQGAGRLPSVAKNGDLLAFSFNDYNSSRSSQLGTGNQTTELSPVTISFSTGSLSLSSSSLTFTDGMTFTLTDVDRNNDTRTKENITVIIRLNWTSSISQGDEARLYLNETDKSSGTFQGRLRVQPDSRTRANNSLVSGGLTTGATVPGDVYRFAAFNSTNPAIRLTALLRTSKTTDPANTKADFNITYVDPFPTTSANNRAIATVSVSRTQATISLDKSAYNPPATATTGGDTAVLTLTEPDANLDSTSVESLRLTRQATSTTRSYSTVNQSSAQKAKVGTLMIIRIRDKTETRVPIDGLAAETGANTGIFTVSFNLTTGAFGATFASADTLRVRYFDEVNQATSTNATATIGGTLGLLTIGWNQIPMSNSGCITFTSGACTTLASSNLKVNVTIQLIDTDANANPNAIEQATVHIVVLNATSLAANYSTPLGTPGAGCAYTLVACQGARWYNQTLLESGANTGNFTALIQLFFNATDSNSATYMYNSTTNVGRRILDRTRDMINGAFQVFWNDSLATTTLPTIGGLVGSPSGAGAATKAVKATANIVPSTGTISLDVTTAGMGGKVKVTLTDPDLNLDVKAKETKDVVRAEYFNDTASLVAGGPAVSTLRLSETDVNTGIYTGTFTLGTVDGTRTGLRNAYPGVYIRFRYPDGVTSAGLYNIGLGKQDTDAAGFFRVKSNTATIKIDKSVYGPFGSMNVTLYDPDLLYNKTNVVLTKIRTDTSGDEINSILPSNMYPNGTFTFKIPITRSPDTAVSTTNLRLEVNATDSIFVFYTDPQDATGSPKILQLTAKVTSADGVLTLDKANYLVGEFITVTINDADANTVTTTRQSITMLVTTTSYPAGSNVTLQETDLDTGIFTGKVQIVTTLPSGAQVLGATGDTITVKYIDQIGTGGSKKNLFATAKVGTAVPKTQQAPAGVPALVDSSGNALTTIKAGDLTNIQATVKNNITTSLTITYLVQVKDATGVVVNLAWIKDITLASGTSTSPSVSWIPVKAGTYTVEVFVWDGLTTAVALSPSQKITVTVG